MTPTGLVRGAYGLVLLLAPGWVVRHVAGRSPGAVSMTVVRVLGARDVSQALLGSVAPSADVLALGAEVDGMHALSMLVLAGLAPRWRRAALVSAAVAGSFAVAGAFQSRREAHGAGAGSAPSSQSPLGRFAHERDTIAATVRPYALPAAVSSRVFGIGAE